MAEPRRSTFTWDLHHGFADLGAVRSDILRRFPGFGGFTDGKIENHSVRKVQIYVNWLG